MVQYHKPATKTKRSGSGGKHTASSDKRKAHFGGFFARPTFDVKAKEEKHETKRSKGGGMKIKSKIILFVNLAMSGGKVKRVKITNVTENPANRLYPRENIITKGAIIETEAGKARVTSRPAQDGTVNAILLQKG
ncbi:MAG TPA: 30S ribosomal protein S8e [Candidatus Norongarragalinales archaeon]|jgi:small subunit ribosomal protein S8e|nr:30S ribosomal protein S8e [Candidatus Norongarragalinales archaeon]